MTGARWVQTELFTNRAATNVRGFAVWFPMYPADAKARWPAEALTDGRITHRWDESKTIGRFFLAHLSELGPRVGGVPYRTDADALWDAYLLFDAAGRWTSTLPDGLVSWGSTIVQTRDRLGQDIRVIDTGKSRTR